MEKEDFRIKMFAAKVKAIAKDRFIKIGDLEEKLGLHIGYFSRISSGVCKNVNLVTALKISDLFGMTIEEIINFKTREEEIAAKLNDTLLKELLNDFSKEDLINYIQKKEI